MASTKPNCYNAEHVDDDTKPQQQQQQYKFGLGDDA